MQQRPVRFAFRVTEFTKSISNHPALFVQPVFPIRTTDQFVLAPALMRQQALMHIGFCVSALARQIVHLQRVVAQVILLLFAI